MSCHNNLKKDAALKWTPTLPQRRPDYIMSSSFREKGQMGFKPSYEKEPREKMWYLMSNEYMRIWNKEKAFYEKYTYTRAKIIKDESKIKRRFVQRMTNFKPVTKTDMIENELKRRQLLKNNPEKIKDLIKKRYKIWCTEDINPFDSLDKKKDEKKTQDVSKTKKESDNVNVITAELVCGCNCNEIPSEQ